MGFDYDEYVRPDIKARSERKKKRKRSEVDLRSSRASINQVDSGRTRDIPMHERPEWERNALRRLRAIDEREW